MSGSAFYLRMIFSPIIKSLKLSLSLQIMQNLLKYMFFIYTSTKNKNMTSHRRYKQVGTRALERNHQCSLMKFVFEVCISAISAHEEINKF